MKADDDLDRLQEGFQRFEQNIEKNKIEKQRKITSAFISEAYKLFYGTDNWADKAIVLLVAHSWFFVSGLGAYSLIYWLLSKSNSTSVLELLTGKIEPSYSDFVLSIFFFVLIGFVFTALISFLLVIFRFSMNMRNAQKDFHSFASILNDPVTLKISEVKRLTEESSKLLTAMSAKLEPYMVSWEQSARIEIDSEKVYSLTRDLAWLEQSKPDSELDVLGRIIEDALEHENKTYSYLLYKADDSDAIKIFERLTRFRRRYLEANNKVKKIMNERIVIKALVSHEHGNLESKKINWDFENDNISVNWLKKELVPLPLPGDMVLYQNVGQSANGIAEPESSVLVSSRGLINDGTGAEDKFDYIYTEVEQTKAYWDWFKTCWLDHSDS